MGKFESEVVAPKIKLAPRVGLTLIGGRGLTEGEGKGRGVPRGADVGLASLRSAVGEAEEVSLISDVSPPAWEPDAEFPILGQGTFYVTVPKGEKDKTKLHITLHSVKDDIHYGDVYTLVLGEDIVSIRDKSQELTQVEGNNPAATVVWITANEGDIPREKLPSELNVIVAADFVSAQKLVEEKKLELLATVSTVKIGDETVDAFLQEFRGKYGVTIPVLIYGDNIDKKVQQNIELYHGRIITLSFTPQELKALLNNSVQRSQLAMFEPGEERTYWFSCDSKNNVLKYGKGEVFQSRYTLLQYYEPLASPTKRLFSSIKYVSVIAEGDLSGKVWPSPVVDDIPPFIVSTDQITLDNIAKGQVTVINCLSKECQFLYGVVAGPGITLDGDFVKAIQHSIVTEGCICYELLAKKSSSNPHQKYLRITVGTNQGYSPGIPFVLEIWPSGYFSPIHAHSKSYAIIKVLHGSISGYYYPGLFHRVEEYYQKLYLTEGDVTWISPEMYSVHKLVNENPDTFCATIQCYKYADADTIHYESFDCLNPDGSISNFVPGSDMDYLIFKNRIMEEWNNKQA